jgi:HAMP domain-containing protein
LNLYRRVLDELWLYDASHLPPKLIASDEQNHLVIQHKRLYRLFEQQTEEFHEKEGN